MIENIPSEAFVWAGGIANSIVILLIGVDVLYPSSPIPYWPASLGVLIFVAQALLLWPTVRTACRITTQP